ncbi:LysR substrate-binding domain-containing protein [Zhongshania guokunii]|uniref:LysR substrate-binding domain-containing protein n=1 Tax=Zhongshania guokunii TaxID=641783 RepID=A0ABV3U184_9GAMM
MNPNKLRHIVAVDRCGSLTAAAKQVHITQSALTKNIADIEDEIGFALFERYARGVHATAQGRAFIDRAARIVADLDQLATDAKMGRQLTSSRIRVGVCPPSLVSLLNTALTQMLMTHPDVRIEQTTGWIEQSIHHLVNRDIDLLVGPAPAIMMHKSQFTIHLLPPLEICFFVRKAHPLSGRSNISIGELNQFPMALADRSVATAELINQLFGAPVIPPDKQLHIIGHFSAACKIVANTDTIGTVAASYRENDSFLEEFSLLSIVEEVDPIPLAAAYSSKFLPSEPMKTLVSMLES